MRALKHKHRRNRCSTKVVRRCAYVAFLKSFLQVDRFADGEVNVMVKENVRGKDVYIIQPTCMPVNENLVELLLMVSESLGRIRKAWRRW